MCIGAGSNPLIGVTEANLRAAGAYKLPAILFTMLMAALQIAQLSNHSDKSFATAKARQAAQGPAGPHPFRVHLQMLDKRTPTLHIKPAPSNPGNKHLDLDTLGVRHDLVKIASKGAL